MKFERGTVGLARLDYTYYSSIDSSLIGEGYNSGYAQFFIMAQDETALDGYYTAFGKVIDGWSNIENIINNEQVQNQETGQLKNNLVIKKTLIDLKGKEYQEVEKISE